MKKITILLILIISQQAFGDEGKDYDTSLDYSKFYLLALPATFYFLDDEIDRLSLENKSEATSHAADIFRQFGEPINFIVIAPTLYGVSLWSENSRLERFAWRLTKASLLAGGIQQSIARLVGRGRPRAGFNSRDWNGPTNSKTRIAFPSGHTALAWTLGTLVADEYKENSWIPTMSYMTAALSGWSRVHDRAHWVSDVLLGSLVGHLAARFVIISENRKAMFLPVIDDDKKGVSFVYQF